MLDNKRVGHLLERAKKRRSGSIVTVAKNKKKKSNFIEPLSLWGANSCLKGKDLPHHLRKPGVHYRVHKTPVVDHILEHFSSAHILSS